MKRLLPIAAVPAAAAAGLAAAFTLGNGTSSASATADVAGHQAAAAAGLQQAKVSAAQPVSIARQSATGHPVVRVDAKRMAAIPAKGKHHRALPAAYVVKSGDTLASIAQDLYHSPDYWTVLYWANQAKIKYADEIQVGQQLAVPAKPAKAPGAPKQTAAAPAPATSTVSYSSASTATAAPAQAPAQAQAQAVSAGASSSFQACVIARESGGNPQVMNASGHYGLYQFSASTWAAYGGNPADFGHASVAEQNQVFANAMAAGGESNWAPYDGC